MLELLSPAFSPEAVIAAVQCGADSIYIRFGGESAAKFSEGDFLKSVRYCRVRGCKVYAELDTVFYDGEIASAAQLARHAAEAGVSAIVVQDLGLARVLRSVVPEMPLHAGERLGLHNLAGAHAAVQMGFCRLRLPAEMSLKEIAFLNAHVNIETELVAQGPGCFSRSGHCRMSAFADGKSAARGACGQACRQHYSLGGRMDDAFPLRLKDTCLLSHLEDLFRAGVTCVRIEGEDKPERMAFLTALYADCIREERKPSPGELEQMELLFDHAGFTDGYLTGDQSSLFGSFSDPDPDAKQVLIEARKKYQDTEARRVPVTFYAIAEKGQPLRLAVQDAEGNRAMVSGGRLRETPGLSLTERDIEQAMFKTAGTPFYCTDVLAKVDDDLGLAGDDLELHRQQLLRELTERRAAPVRCKFGNVPLPPGAGGWKDKRKMIFQVLTAEQLTPELAALGPDYVYVPLEVLQSDFDRLQPFTEAGAIPVAVLPYVIADPEMPQVIGLLEKARGFGVAQALVSSFGHIPLARRAGMEVRGDLGIGVFNSYTAALADDARLASVTAPCELTIQQITKLCKPVPTEIIIYGRVPLMLSDSCVVKRSSGRCTCYSSARLSDNKGAAYPIVKEFGCRNAILHALKIYMADKRPEYDGIGLWGERLIFTTESPRECVEVARGVLGLSDYRPNGLTRGLYYRGV